MPEPVRPLHIVGIGRYRWLLLPVVTRWRWACTCGVARRGYRDEYAVNQAVMHHGRNGHVDPRSAPQWF